MRLPKSKVPKAGRKPRTVVRLSAKGMEELREDRFVHAEGICELRSSPKCKPMPGFMYGHLAHVKSRGAGGSDTFENVRWSCAECHIGFQHNGGKPCPPKPSREEMQS